MINTMNLKLLQVERKHQGYILTQEVRTKRYALYKIDDTHYEVVKVRRKKLSPVSAVERILHDQGYTHREVYPSSEEWGMYGWSYSNRLEAMKKYTQLTIRAKVC